MSHMQRKNAVTILLLSSNDFPQICSKIADGPSCNVDAFIWIYQSISYPKRVIAYCLLHYCVVSCFFTISTMQEGTNPARTTKGELRNRDQRGQKLNFCRICNFQILFKIIRCGTWAQCGLGGRAGKVTPAEAGASEPTTTTGDGYTQDIFHQNACQRRDPDPVLVARPIG